MGSSHLLTCLSMAPTRSTLAPRFKPRVTVRVLKREKKKTLTVLVYGHTNTATVKPMI